MRQIKFRAWDGEKMHRVIEYSAENCRVPLPRFPYSESIIPEDVMQYTGLKDKNGKEIYEGDELLVEWVGGKKWVGSVVWSSYELHSFLPCWCCHGKKNTIGLFVNNKKSNKVEMVEIIGNKYETT